MRGIAKRYPGVVALHGVDLDVRRGEVHGLLGENGAGKSTLMKILAGAVRRDAGTIAIDGRPFDPASPRAAQAAGIGIIYQEFNLVPHLSVAENICLGKEPGGFFPGLIDRGRLLRDAERVLGRLGVAIDAEDDTLMLEEIEDGIEKRLIAGRGEQDSPAGGGSLQPGVP